MAAPSSPLYGENHAGLAHEDDEHFYDDKDPASHSQGTPLNDPKHLQKRRRVTRACDECRRKKIKCDGKQPCTHCTVYSYGKVAYGVGVQTSSLTKMPRC